MKKIKVNDTEALEKLFCGSIKRTHGMLYSAHGFDGSAFRIEALCHEVERRLEGIPKGQRAGVKARLMSGRGVAASYKHYRKVHTVLVERNARGQWFVIDWAVEDVPPEVVPGIRHICVSPVQKQELVSAFLKSRSISA